MVGVLHVAMVFAFASNIFFASSEFTKQGKLDIVTKVLEMGDIPALGMDTMVNLGENRCGGKALVRRFLKLISIHHLEIYTP